MPNLLRRLISRLGANHPAVAILQPATPAPVMPELSCFIKGLIKSMETEPDKWFSFSKQSYAYEHPKVVLMTCLGVDSICDVFSDSHQIHCTDNEQGALCRAITTHLQVPRWKAAVNPVLDHFSSLGCPPSQS